MEKWPDYSDKSKDQLIAELNELHKKYSSLQKSYDLMVSDIEQQNDKLSKLNQFSVEVSDLATLVNLEVIISKMIKEITGAKFTVFSEYNTERKTLSVQHIELEPGLLEKIISIIGSQIKKMEVPVSEEIYQMMATEIIGVRETLYEATFGSITRPIGAAIQKLLNVDRFIGIAYLIEGKLYGTSLLAMTRGLADPSRQILENILFLVGLTLRRRKAENALIESKTQTSAILQAIPDMMFLQNNEGVYLDYYAPKGSPLYVPPETFMGKNMREVLPFEIAIEYQKIFEEAIKTKLVQSYEYALTMPYGKAYFESKTIAYERDKVLSIIRDITERKQSELKIQRQNQELIKLNEDKDRFMSILAHDLKGPFNSILGFLDLLTNNLHKYDIDKITRLITTINNSSKHFYQLLESLLIWARSQSGKMTILPQQLNITEICLEIVNERKLSADSKLLEIKLMSEEIFAFADAETLKTVLRNLISNAIKFTQPKGRIHIYTEDNNDALTIVVSDNGIGIPQENLDSLFNISHYHSTQGTLGESGTGLGLFLCKELVEKNNGKIWAESTPGVGSKFKFTLPKFEHTKS